LGKPQGAQAKLYVSRAAGGVKSLARQLDFCAKFDA